jgi:glucose-6-phosphate 1-dehydrogenase
MIERMVLFGASGDLTSRLLMPAVAQMLDQASRNRSVSVMVAPIHALPAHLTLVTGRPTGIAHMG